MFSGGGKGDEDSLSMIEDYVSLPVWWGFDPSRAGAAYISLGIPRVNSFARRCCRVVSGIPGTLFLLAQDEEEEKN